MCAVWGCTCRRHQGVTFGELCVDLFQLAFANLDAERISYFRAAVKPFAKKFPGLLWESISAVFAAELLYLRFCKTAESLWGQRG